MIANVGKHKYTGKVYWIVFEDVLEKSPEEDAIFVKHFLDFLHIMRNLTELLVCFVFVTHIERSGEDYSMIRSDNDQSKE